MLRWGASKYASRYRVCIDVTNNNRCDKAWTSTYTQTSASLTGLKAGTTYYWQVQAVNAHGVVYADRGRWFAFTVPASTP